MKCTTGNTNDFNPRSPRGERLYMLTEGHSAPKDFNPRSPRGERPPCLHLIYHERRISIHAPRGGSDPPGNIYMCKIMISIHAPRGGSDLFVADDTGHREIFQSTLPAGGATRPSMILLNRSVKFQSTLPAGGATRRVKILRVLLAFQSTLPAGGATPLHGLLCRCSLISIHAPRGGSDYFLFCSLAFS